MLYIDGIALKLHLIFFLYFAIFILHSRESDVSLYFGRDVRTHLGFSIWTTCLPHKAGGIPLSALPKDTTSELAGLFSTTSPKCRAPSREAADAIF